MKRWTKIGLVFALTGWIGGLMWAGNTLTREDLIKMTKAGLDEGLILEAIHGATSVPALTTDDIIALKGEGVSQKVLQAVMVRRRELDALGQAPSAVGTVQPPAATPDFTARFPEAEGMLGKQPFEKVLAFLLKRSDDVRYEGLAKLNAEERTILEKFFASFGKAEEFTYGESSGRMLNMNRMNWVESCPAYVFVRKNGIVHIVPAVAAHKVADEDPTLLDPQDTSMDSLTKDEVEFVLSETKYKSVIKRDTKCKVRLKSRTADLGAALLSVGWKKK